MSNTDESQTEHEQLPIAKPEEPNYGSIEEPAASESANTARYTVQQALDHFGLGLGNLLAIGCAFIANFEEGAEMMILPIILPKLRCEWELSAWFTVLVPVAVVCAAIVGSDFVAVVSGTFGRLSIMTVGLFLSFFFAVLSAFSQNIWHFLLLRSLLAMAMGMSTCISQAYVIEMCPKKSRALMESANVAFWAVGSLASAVLSYFLLELIGWRIILLILAVPIIIGAIILCFQRESPFYDVASGRLRETQKTLDFICRHNKAENLPGKVRKHEEVKNPVLFTPLNLLDTSFTKTFVIESAVLLFMFCVAYIFLGFTSWATPRIVDEGYCEDQENFAKETLQKTCHRYSESSLRSLSIGTAGELVGNIIFFMISHTVGRLPSLKIGAVGNTLVMLSMLFCGGSWKITTDIFLVRLLNSGMFVTLLVYINEYYPTHLRGIANAVSFSVGRTFSLFTIIPAVLIDMEDMEVLIIGIMIASSLTVIASFVLTKETKDMDLI